MSVRSVAEAVYARRIQRGLTHIPNHVAIIQDGNRRYAKSRGKGTGYGHRLGADTSERVLDWMGELGIRHVTFFAFSTENFQRPEEEKAELHQLFLEKFTGLLTDRRVYENEINVTMIGDRALLEADLLKVIEETEAATKNHSRYFVHVALAYGGRNEIVTTARKIAAAVFAGKISADEITPDLVTEKMSQGVSIPPVDLTARPPNNRRTSKLLPA